MNARRSCRGTTAPSSARCTSRTRAARAADARKGEMDGSNIPTDRMWKWLNRGFSVHTRMYRLTRGVVGHRFPGAPPMLLLDHVGAKTGTKRTTPLVYVDDSPNLVLVASKGGHPKHPAWYHNLRANPDAAVQVGAERRAVHARVASEAER